MSDPQQRLSPAPSKARIGKLLSHPVLGVMGVIGSVASLISIPLALYFYFGTRERVQLTYYINPVKAVMVRGSESSRLSASFDGKQIKSDITAVQIAIWNQGYKPIRNEGVLKPLVISVENGTPILEATIRKASRDVIRLALNNEELQAGRLTVSWSILEHNDGGVIQLIYAGGADLNIRADGVMEGQSGISRLEFSEKIKSPDEQYNSTQKEGKRSAYFMFVMGGLGSLFVVFGIIRRRRHKVRLKPFDFFIIVQPILFFVVGLFMMLKAQAPGPPFGF